MSGVDDPVWDTEWGDIYHSLPPMKWYSVYGNHDYGQFNRECACTAPGVDTPGNQCAQVLKHGGVHNNQEWYMPVRRITSYTLHMLHATCYILHAGASHHLVINY